MHNRSINPPRGRQGGAGALALVLILVGAASLATLWIGRTLWTEHRGLSAQVNSVLAQETAQFGLDRAWALLHEARAVDAQCRPVPAASGSAVVPDALHRLLSAGSAAAAPLVACARVGAAWACQCPVATLPAASPGAAPGWPGGAVGDREAFVVQATIDAAGPDPLVRLTATACAEGGIACASSAAAGGAPASAFARLTADHALRGAVAAVPAAAIAAGGAVRLGSGPADRVRVVNTDLASHGLVLQAGGAIDTGSAVITGLPGAPLAGALVADDVAMARGDAAARLGAWLGSAPVRWRDWPRVARLECAATGCDGAALEGLLDQGHRAVAVRGSLRWTPGGAVRPPFVLLVEGALEVDGPGRIDAVLLAQEVRLRNPSAAALEVRGGVIAAGDVVADGAVTVLRDPTVLAAVRDLPLALGRVSGHWRAVPLP